MATKPVTKRPPWIPEKVVIDNIEWDVIIVQTIVDDHGMPDPQALGATLRDKRQIHLALSAFAVGLEGLREVWLHELLHAIWPRSVVDHETEERIVEALADPLARLLASNKALRKHMRLPQKKAIPCPNDCPVKQQNQSSQQKSQKNPSRSKKREQDSKPKVGFVVSAPCTTPTGTEASRSKRKGRRAC